MPYNSLITRTDAAALIPEEVSREIIQGVVTKSAVMSLGRKLQNMPRAQTRMPVLSSLPTGYFVNGDTGLKQTTEMAWANKYLDAEEIAVIVPIPENVLSDADYDIWGEVRPRIEEEFGRVFDAAVFYGTNAPTSWPDDLLTAATAASHTIDYSTQIAAGQDLFDIVMGEGGLLSLVEEDGFEVNGHVGAMVMKSRLRGLREKVYNGSAMVAVGQPLFAASLKETGGYTLDGSPIMFPKNGLPAAATALLFSGDFSQLVWTLRTDITYKLLTEAVIQDGTGAIVYNLAQQDMVALRAVMRVAWQVPNPITRMQETEASRFPFSVLVP